MQHTVLFLWEVQQIVPGTYATALIDDARHFNVVLSRLELRFPDASPRTSDYRRTCCQKGTTMYVFLFEHLVMRGRGLPNGECKPSRSGGTMLG
jgi:hypothetical protein